MTYVKVSIPKKAGGAGSPVPKDPNVIFVRVRDILNATGDYEGFPTRSGVMSSGSLSLKEGEKAVGVYLTPITINRFDNSEGDPDKAGFISNFIGEHPGDESHFAEWLQENLNEDFIIISKECSDATGTRLQGTPCNPMKLAVEGQDNNEGKMSTLTFASIQRAKWKMMHYTGDMPDLADAASEGSAGGGV